MKNTNTYNKTVKKQSIRLYSKVIFALIIGLLSLASCKKGQPIGPNQSSIDRKPNLKASSTNLQLSEANFDKLAEDLIWTPGSNHGTNSAIDYTIQIDLKGQNFSNPSNIKMGRNVYDKKYTTSDFNKMLLNQLNLAPNTNATVEVRIKSSTSDTTIKPQFSNVENIKVATYKPVSSTLYLIGDATPNGWDANNATPMKQDPNTPYVFTYQGNLSAGQFKFITTKGQFLPSYNEGQDSTKLFYRTKNTQPDNKFTITNPGPYSIKVDLVHLTITLKKLAGPAYNKLWIIGSATAGGWSLNNAAQLRQDPGNPFIFTFNDSLSVGEFKIATKLDFNAPFYRPTTNHPAISDTTVQLNAGSPDNKWYISQAGAYHITLNLQNMTIHIKPFKPYSKLWMVGDATPNGWDINNPTQMTVDPNDPFIFTYNGPLSTGEFKIPTETGNWSGYYFTPGINHPSISSTFAKLSYVVSGGSKDIKWQISTAGNYTVKLDQLHETIKIIKN
ncbi:MAG TPA: SusF/SusE family outer membrane protein [Balneolales bacterium]|nr:SusF/SusE family outer membrane protein [Balneolales bacterium]